MGTAAKVGGGLVEISAVATIIGAPIAEALIHGLKGACGMVWAPMSTFGAIHVSKACLAASMPDHLREAMGLRNAHVDAAIGVMLRVDHSKKAKSRVDLGDACAIQLISDPLHRVSAKIQRQHKKTTSAHLENAEYNSYQSPRRRAMCIYTLDRNSQLSLDTVQATERGQPVMIHRFEPDVAGLPPGWKDWSVLLVSLIKLTEVFALWKLGSVRLWYWTMAGWCHAFLAAIILQVSGLGRDNPLLPTNDIVAGVLPTPLHLGGKGKVVLGIPANVRRHPLWRTLLALGTFCNVAGLLGTFIFLGKEPSNIIYMWVGFQALWLISRTVVFYFVEGAAAARQGLISAKTWDEVDVEERQRVLALLGGLSRHQVSIHPRGVLAYRQDCLSFNEIVALFDQAQWNLTPRLPGNDNETRSWNLNIKAVAGDPLIRSAVWLTGANLNNSELYDATVAFITLGKGLLATPCVRVWSCDCLPDSDRQRGNAHPDCGMVKWLYFIPVNSGGQDQWLHAHGLSSIGLLMSELLSDKELDRRLQAGRYRISIHTLEDLERALAVARDSVELVMDLVKSASITRGNRREDQKIRSNVASAEVTELREEPLMGNE